MCIHTRFCNTYNTQYMFHLQVILSQPYTAAVDVWSLGCIFAELLGLMKENIKDYRKRKALFPGER